MNIVQPRHVYAASDRTALGHVYFPYSAFMIAARLRLAGVDVAVIDENLSSKMEEDRPIGLACIGAPYVAPIMERLKHTVRADRAFVGGQGSRGFERDEFAQLFGSQTINGSNNDELQGSGIASSPIPEQECSSIDRELIELSDEQFKLYFSREAPLYLSQGCRYSCTFCAAQRSDPSNGIRVREVYRSMSPLARELKIIAERSSALGMTENHFYLSNLDLFQNPKELNQFLDVISEVRGEFPKHKFVFRGLATTSAFMLAHRRHPDLIRRFVGLGLRQLGFGIDGATPDVWRAIRKPHSESTCLEAVATAAEDYSIIPEALMVFGHEGHDSEKSLALAVDTVRMLGERYGAVPRPHVAKGLVPGNDGWRSHSYKSDRAFLMENPWAFQFLDFTCLPTDLTHRDPTFREAVKRSFLEICELPNCLTLAVMPEDRRLPKTAFDEAIAFNEGRFDI